MTNNEKSLRDICGDNLIDSFINEVKACYGCTSLEQLESAYTNMMSSRDEIIEILDEVDSQTEGPVSMVNRLLNFEGSLFTNKIPTFTSDDTLDQIEEYYEEYLPYFQRYGCMSSDWIISWDDGNVLFYDVDSGIAEIVKRPDILLSGE